MHKIKYCFGYTLFVATTSRFTGRIPLARAFEVKRTRYGVGVSTQSITRAVKLDQRARAVVDKAIEKIESEFAQRKKTSNAVDFEVSKRKAGILAAVRDAGYRKLHASELVASLMDFAGLEKESLLPYVNAARYLVRRGQLKIDGSASLNYYSSLARSGLLKKAREILLSAERPLTTLDMAQRLGYSRDISREQRFGIINSLGSCLGLLDLSKLVVKLPQVPVGKKGTEHYLWWAAEHRIKPETKPTGNYRYRLMQALDSGPRTALGLGQVFGLETKMVKGKAIRMQPKWVTSHLQFLVDGKVVKSTGGKLDGLAGGATYELTGLGREILDEQKARESITPAMRLVLLGEHQDSLIGGEKRKYEHFKRWASVLVEYDKSREPHRLSTKYGVNPATIVGWGAGRYLPFRRLEVIRGKYLPRLAHENPGLAKTFGAWLEKHLLYFKA